MYGAIAVARVDDEQQKYHMDVVITSITTEDLDMAWPWLVEFRAGMWL
jgi:hypothetical protein